MIQDGFRFRERPDHEATIRVKVYFMGSRIF